MSMTSQLSVFVSWQEVPENGADVCHLGQVHSPFIGAGIDLRYMWSKAWSFAQHIWHAQWEAKPDPDGHIGVMRLTHNLSIFGFHLPFLDLSVVAQQVRLQNICITCG